tara:strand:+ start:268 stop:1134 length:867 start_codon:yes stop_codon:yes gene_type:complete
MAHYSIKELEKFSGIKAHTLRIWEKRYELLKPQRTDTNIRYYCDSDLKRLLNVALLSNSGKKISQIAKLSDQELFEEVKNIDQENVEVEKRITTLITAMIDFNEDEFSDYFNLCVKEIGFEKTLVNVIHPFLEKVGILWLSDEIQPGQEHFVSNLIRNKIIAAIDNLAKPVENTTAILYLPEGEYHEIGLLYFYYLLKKKGIRVYYLGQSVPANQVKTLSEHISPDYIITYSIILRIEELKTHVNEMSTYLAKEVIFLENPTIESNELDYPSSIIPVKNKEELLARLA